MRLKKIIISSLAMALIIISAPLVNAQHPAVDDFHKFYKDKDDVHMIVLDGGIFQLLAWVASWDQSDEDAAVFKKLTENIEGLNLIVVPKAAEGKYTFADVKKHIRNDNFSELMNVREDGSLISFYAQGNEKEVRDMIIFIDDSSEYCIISVKGVLNSDDLKYLANHHKELQ